MKLKHIKTIINASCVGIFWLGFISVANATLESRLGGLAYYDTDLDITWAASIHPVGRQSVSSLTIAGISGWRLPSADVDRDSGLWPGPIQSGRGLDNELDHLQHDELISIDNPGPFEDMFSWFTPTESNPYRPNFLTDTLAHIIPIGEHIPGPRYYTYNFEFGHVQSSSFEPSGGTTWPVHDGDVGLLSPIPEPEQYLMLIMGLAGMFGYARYRRRI